MKLRFSQFGFFALTLLATDIAFAATEAHGEAAEKGLPQFDPTWFPSQIFWLFVMFGLLYLFFANKTLPTLSKVIDNRRNLIESEMEEAENLTAKAKAVQETYEANLAKARMNSTSEITKVEDKIKADMTKAEAEFRTRAEKEMAKLEKSIEKSKAQVMAELESMVATLTAEAVEKLADISIKPDEVQKLVGEIANDTETKEAA